MAKATEEANKAKALIDQATSNNDVDQAQTNGINIINSIDADVIKKQMQKAIEQAAEAKKALINQNSDATQEEKDAAIQRVTDEVRNAIDLLTNLQIMMVLMKYKRTVLVQLIIFNLK